MAEYIDRDELLKELCTVSAPTPSESWIVEKCIEKVNEQPTADVVPKSEVERLEGELIVESTRRKNAVNAYHDAKTEVAREIFEELAREVYSKIPDKILPVTFGEMSRHLDYNDGLNFGSRNAYIDTLKIIAELKKKYTE